ncbi:MAG: hypothetical protein AAFY65_14295 [Pseudomonadota bacterium]
MIKWGLAVLLLGAFGATVFAGRGLLADSPTCQAAKDIAATYNGRAPMPVDRVTTLLAIEVDCGAQIFTYRKQLTASPGALPPGWQGRMQAQHNALHCNAQGLASASGWTARDVIATPDGAVFVTFQTTPADCS